MAQRLRTLAVLPEVLSEEAKLNISEAMTGYRVTTLGLGLIITITKKSHRLYPAGEQSELRQTSTRCSRTLRIAYLTCI